MSEKNGYSMQDIVLERVMTVQKVYEDMIDHVREQGTWNQEKAEKAISNLATPARDGETGAGGDTIRIPTRPKDLNRWRATWRKIKGQWKQSKSYEEMSTWLGKMHPNLGCAPETLADIIRAGEAGRLD